MTNMPSIYFDWSLRRGVMALYGEEGDEHRVFLTLGDLIASLDRPHRLIGEMTFDSFNLPRRAEAIQQAKDDGHQLLCVPTRQTTKARMKLARAMGWTEEEAEKNDLVDAQAIRHEVQAGMALCAPSPAHPPLDPAYKLAFDAIAKELMESRANGRHTFNRNGKPKFVSDKEDLAEKLDNLLPDINAQAEWIQKALGSSEKSKKGYKGYNRTALAAIGIAVKHAKSRRLFDAVTGLYAHAHGSQLRADLMFWVYAGGGPRAKLYNKKMLDKASPAGRDYILDNFGKRNDGLTLTQFRRAVRWLRAQILLVS